MTKCDSCHFEAPNVLMGDACPECGRLVGYPVPDAHSRGTEIANYDQELSDKALQEAIQAVAERNFATLLRRKRKAEQAIGIGREQGAPPNATPEAAAADPAVQPQPDGEADGGDAEGSEAPEDSTDDQLDTENLT
jgi:hypothetical protein